MQRNPELTVDLAYGLLNVTLVPTEYGPFASPQARLALAYAFDYDAYTKMLMKGFARQAQGPLARGTDGQDRQLPLFHTDLARARQLFTQAGIKPGTAITLWYTPDDEWRKAAAEIAQGQLSQLGFNVTLQQRDSATFWSLVFNTTPASQRPNLWATGWSPDYNDAVDWLSPLYHSRDAAGDGGANAGLYHNAEVDRGLAQAAVTLDAAARQRQLDRIQTILTVTDPAAVYVADIPDSTVNRRALHGYYFNPVYYGTYDYYSMWK
jgi:peptide/nickel transport system substrate-binding protein